MGCLIAALPGLQHGPLFYRALEKCKDLALKESKGNFDKPVTLSVAAILDIQWWHTHVEHATNHIHPPPVALVLYSDASIEGWGVLP